MRKAVILCFFLVGTAGYPQTIPLNAKLQAFRQEVERENGRKVNIIAEEKGQLVGYTQCGLRGEDITIHIVLRAIREEEDAVVAHELGHAYLCKSGVNSMGWEPGMLAENVDKTQLEVTATILVSCLLEKGADDEARKRGFDLKPSEDAMIRTQQRQYPEGIVQQYRRYGTIFAKHVAVSQFCLENELPSLKNTHAQKLLVAAVPEIGTTLDSLRRDITAKSCTTLTDCFKGAKQIRHAAGLDGYILLWNVKTGPQKLE